MTDALLTISSGVARKPVRLSFYLDATARETARNDANAWVKSLRQLPIEGVPMRRRFTFRGDSLWWFTELFLHKQQVINALIEAIAAAETLIAREAPARIAVERADPITRYVLELAAQRHRIQIESSGGSTDWQLRQAKLTARARWLHVSALASRLRPRSQAQPRAGIHVAAFVHRAFWRERANDGSDEAYIGPVLEALSRQAGEPPVFISLGPPENFAARRWWSPLAAERDAHGNAIETYAPLETLRESRAVWGSRHDNRRVLFRSDALRQAAVIHGYDCWPFIREELAGVALLQWPWSARAMDEAAAALDRLRPAVALTYAEAGGWGRALLLEARRREIPIAGLQHGFIYRHWLNYLHEPDEIAADPQNRGDKGFPLPSRTLLFDGYAEQHLRARGHFPADSLAVTGSPRLDAIVAAARQCSPDGVREAAALARAGARRLVLVVTKYKEAAPILREVLDAAAAVEDVHVAIKTHPAETPEVYEPVAGGRPHVTVLPASTPLAPLLLASELIVTVNSTVAIDAAVLGRRSLVVGLPNNLSPFVDEGLMAGAADGGVEDALRRILYDQELRLQLDANRERVLARHGIRSDGSAADRAAAAILELAAPRV